MVVAMPRTSTSRTASSVLVRMSPGEQLRAGRLPRRIAQLVIGLFLYGFSMALLIRASLGLDPWDVLHQGLTRYVPLSFGQVTICVSILVLLLWIPLRQWPGLGTVCNAILVGVFVDLSLAMLPPVHGLPARIVLLVSGIVLNGLAGAAYIGAQLGPGARDGLMTGLVARTGRPVWLVRTGLEASVVAVGFLLGGDLWIGTVAYAIGIGPLVQLFLPLVAVRVEPPVASTDQSAVLAGAGVGARRLVGGGTTEPSAESTPQPVEDREPPQPPKPTAPAESAQPATETPADGRRS
jgi:uncharacterized membrane protein YczE